MPMTILRVDTNKEDSGKATPTLWSGGWNSLQL